MFIPATPEECRKLGWKQPDIILVTGDAYIDSPYDGTAVIGKVLIDAGYKVCVISQPDINSGTDITRFGEPRLFWGVSGGCVDSMVANYTALLKKKRSDDLTPGGLNEKRPDRAVIRYTNLIKQFYKNNKPVIIGGIEASLRRIAHYDYWSDSLRRSILFDSKADILVYGMGEQSILQLAERIESGSEFHDIRGICYISSEPKADHHELPSFEEVTASKEKFAEMFMAFYDNNDPVNARGLVQKHGSRYLVQNPPQIHPTTQELDKWHELPYEYDVHPSHKKEGKVKALDTIQFSVNTHRGCFGDCNFCAITVHQGRKISSRSEASIIREAELLTKHKDFKGYITDLGGPTANMYGMTCKKQTNKGSCQDKRCIFPERCPAMKFGHDRQIELYRKVRMINKIKKVFVSSGIRFDIIMDDHKDGLRYIEELTAHHVSGQLKIAPEHINDKVTSVMGKNNRALLTFKKHFDAFSRKHNKKQFLTYYLIAAHPGCEYKDMVDLGHFSRSELKLNPEQVQIFTPTPSTYSTLMYYTGKNPFTGEKVFVEKGLRGKASQKEAIVHKK